MAPEARIPYPFVVDQVEKDGGGYEWVAEVFDLSGCIAVADTHEGMLLMLADAIEDWIDAAKRADIPVPPPSHEEEYSGNIMLRTSPAMHRRLSLLAKRNKLSLNQYVLQTLQFGMLYGNIWTQQISAARDTVTRRRSRRHFPPEPLPTRS